MCLTLKLETIVTNNNSLNLIWEKINSSSTLRLLFYVGDLWSGTFYIFQLTGDAVYVFRFRGSSRAALVHYQLSLSMFKTLTPSEKYHQHG